MTSDLGAVPARKLLIVDDDDDVGSVVARLFESRGWTVHRARSGSDALAFVRGRNYALPQDVLDMALDVIRHRIVLSYEALSDNVTGDDILAKILDRIPIPVVPLHEHANRYADSNA